MLPVSHAVLAATANAVVPFLERYISSSGFVDRYDGAVVPPAVGRQKVAYEPAPAKNVSKA
jgi:hypothetical protein